MRLGSQVQALLRRALSDPGGVEAALARAEQRRAYADEELSIFALAAAIAYALAHIHQPFVDNNKRIAFYAAFGTLRMNGWGARRS